MSDENNEFVRLFTESEDSPKLRDNLFSLTESKVVKRIYGLARLFCDVFEENELFYWTSGGTSLGAMRHQGLIPWDDDLDICIRQKDEDKFLLLSDVFHANNIGVYATVTFGYRLYSLADSEQLGEYRYPFCDVFVMRKKGNKYEIASGSGRVMWPTKWYYVKDVEDYKMRLFGDFYLRCPGNVECYLERTYGVDWREMGATQDYCHIERIYVRPVKFSLEGLKLPAVPFR